MFVTGGTGLVGRHIIEQLRGRGDDVVALARSAPAEAALRARGAVPLRGDLADTGALTRGIAESDATVHAAAVILSRRGWDRYHATNVAPAEAVARAAAHYARRLIHISSVAVYGRTTTYDGGTGSVSEAFGLDGPIFPGDHYARSKREAELAVWRVRDELGLSAIALRPCVIYGEGDRTFANRVASALRRGIAPLVGDGGNPLSVVYAGNVAAAALAALDRPAVTGAFNVANDGIVTLREFLTRFAAGLGVQLTFVRLPRALLWYAAAGADTLMRLGRPSSPMTLLKTGVQFLSARNPFVSAKAERELGWHAIVPAGDAVERTGRWFRERAHPG